MVGINIKKLSFGKISINDILGIELDKNKLKLAQLRITPVRTELINLIQKDISGFSDADISQVLLAILDTLSLKKPQIIDIVNSSWVITKNIEIPSVDPKEIKEIVNLQAGRHTPYARDEIVVDYVNLGVYRRNYTRILLVIVNRSVIKRHFDILSRAGVMPEHIVFSTEAVALNCEYLLRLNTENSEAGLIHMNEESADFIIIFKNKPIFLRHIPIGARQLIFEKEKYYLRFLEEIKRSQEAYLTEDIGKMPKYFILTGVVERLEGLEQQLGIAIEKMNYLKNMPLSVQIVKDMPSYNVSFFNTVASLVSIEKLNIDLTPEEIKLKRVLQLRARELMKSGILVLSVLVLLFFILLNKIYFKTLYLKNIDKKYQVLMQEAKSIEDDFSKLNLVRNYLAKRGYSLQVLFELYDILPQEVELSYIRFEQEGKFSIRGSAAAMSTVFSLVDSLEKSEYFKEAKTRYTTKRKTSSGDFTDFEIFCKLEKFF